MNKQSCGLFTIILACALLLTACSDPETSPPEPRIPGLVNTLAVQTLSAQGITPLISTPGSVFNDPVSTPATDLSRQEFPTQTPLSPLSADSVPLGSSGTSLLLPSIGKCIDVAEFIKDVSIPDNTVLKPGETFTKIWQVRNAGNCTWKPEYALIHVWGDLMEGVTPNPLQKLVKPGQVVDIAIDLVAPSVPGSYQGNWMLQDDLGARFGTGYDAHEQIWVSIISGSPNKKANNFSGRGNLPGFIICGGGG